MKRKNTVYIVSAMLFVALFWGTFVNGFAGQEKQSFQIVTFGDSIFGEVRDETAIPALLEQLTGMTVFNSAMGGTCAAKTTEDRRLDYLTGSLSMVELSRSVYAGDFAVQQSGNFRDHMMEYFAEVIDGLEKVDFESVEIVLIQHGINDYHAGVPIGNPENADDEYTYLGALRMAVETLRKTNPNMRIVLITPPYTWYPHVGLTCEQRDNGGGVLEDYVNAEIALAEELGLEIIDLYHDFLPNENLEDYVIYTRDGLHPNEAGRMFWAEKIARELVK